MPEKLTWSFPPATESRRPLYDYLEALRADSKVVPAFRNLVRALVDQDERYPANLYWAAMLRYGMLPVENATGEAVRLSTPMSVEEMQTLGLPDKLGLDTKALYLLAAIDNQVESAYLDSIEQP